MLIRSQDKTRLVNFCTAIGFCVESSNGKFRIMAEAPDDWACIGIYETEGQARRVLQLIMEKYDLIKKAEFYSSDWKFVSNVYTLPSAEEVL